MPKPTYFKPDKFVDEVIAAMKLGRMDAPAMLAMREQIESMLNERIVSTVISGLRRRELDLFEKILEDHPELDEVDALMVIAPDVPGIKDNLERGINSLFFELTFNFAQVEEGAKQLTA